MLWTGFLRAAAEAGFSCRRASGLLASHAVAGRYDGEMLTACLLALVAADRPDILIIMADDLGYGDIAALNPDSPIRTPHLDRLAAESLVMTDAHSPCSWCIPTRHSLLTGRLPIGLDPKDRGRAVIEDGTLTLPQALDGYRSSMIGKWHLGFVGGEPDNEPGPAPDRVEPLPGGPCDRGFERFFGIPRSLDIPPYYYIAGDQVVGWPTEPIAASDSEGWSKIQGEFWRKGAITPGFRHVDVTPVFLYQMLLELSQPSDRPRLDYLALPSPHTPWSVAPEYVGTSEVAMYGDFLRQVDATVGRILEQLDQTGRADDTIVIFTSDNGPVWYEEDTAKYGHSASGPFRGMKGDAWEGGHRVPMMVRWPERIEPRRSDALTCHADLFATLVAATGSQADVPADSLNFLPHWIGQAAGPRTEFLERPSRHTQGYALRIGTWKYIPFLGSGGFTKPSREKAGPGQIDAQLYDLATDPGETTNLAATHPEQLQLMRARYDELIAAAGAE